ncbi:hypothetical protein JG537_08940 [Streptococcus sp. SL1232]|uniref:hypothetical protein n=1 Tax=Streptococcus vicugnae TaxID=2740579 RepID=UPI0018F5CBA4|nr:hypothetical protein [Streptococcus vicugnae]MBJ7541827.1 hypothetical protein [Streptococcus vicugnae]
MSLEVNLGEIESDSTPDTYNISDVNLVKKSVLNELSKNKDFVEKADIFLSEELYTPSIQSVDLINTPNIGVFNIRGTSNNYLFDEYLGSINVYKGISPNAEEFYDTPNAAIVSRYVAEKNHFHIGDHIELVAYTDIGSSSEKTFSYNIEIVGLYDFYPSETLTSLIANEYQEDDHEHEEKLKFYDSLLENKAQILNYRFNVIYMSNDSVLDYIYSYSENSDILSDTPVYQATFKLHNSNLDTQFSKFANKKLPKYFKIESMSSEFQKHFFPVKYTITLLGGVIFILVMLLVFSYKLPLKLGNIRKEILFLVSHGLRHNQLLIEINKIMIPTNIISLLVGLIAGTYGVKFISNENIESILNIFSDEFEGTGTNLEYLNIDLIPTTPNFEIYLGYSSQYIIISIILVTIIAIITILSLQRYVKKLIG